MYLYIYLFIYLFMYLFIYLFIYLRIYYICFLLVDYADHVVGMYLFCLRHFWSVPIDGVMIRRKPVRSAFQSPKGEYAQPPRLQLLSSWSRDDAICRCLWEANSHGVVTRQPLGSDECDSHIIFLGGNEECDFT